MRLIFKRRLFWGSLAHEADDPTTPPPVGPATSALEAIARDYAVLSARRSQANTNLAGVQFFSVLRKLLFTATVANCPEMVGRWQSVNFYISYLANLGFKDKVSVLYDCVLKFRKFRQRPTEHHSPIDLNAECVKHLSDFLKASRLKDEKKKAESEPQRAQSASGPRGRGKGSRGRNNYFFNQYGNQSQHAGQKYPTYANQNRKFFNPNPSMNQPRMFVAGQQPVARGGQNQGDDLQVGQQ